MSAPHFISQGEDCGNGMVRVWLTQITAGLLREVIGNLQPDAIAAAVERANFEHVRLEASAHPFGSLAVEVIVPVSTYAKLQQVFDGVSDEHNFKQLVETLRIKR
ncbi:MAG: hypothetical protein ACK6BL_06435 [Holosporaceae bacterium]